MAEPLISVLILTRNEALHIERAIEVAKKLTPSIYVVDSESGDGTADLAYKSGATVISGSFTGFAEKLNWSLVNINFPSSWILRLDADELLTDELTYQLPNTLSTLEDNIYGVYVRRQLWFMGKWVRFGGMYPTLSMRVWKKGLARCEVRALDEHMVLAPGGSSIVLEFDIIDNPLSDLSSWISKHNHYATLEAKTFVARSNINGDQFKGNLFGTLPERVRWVKNNIFNRLPLFIRPFLYFLYRYIVRLGFLDGKTGFVFHFMHGLWYRLLVDAKIVEYRLKKNNLL